MPTTDEMIDRISSAAGRVAGQAQVIADRVVPEEERSLVSRVMDLPVTKQLRLARRLWDDPRVGPVVRAPLIAGLAYAVLPIKLTPRFLGPLRDFEKVVGLAAVLWLLIRVTPRDVVMEHLESMERPGLLDRLRGRGKDE